MDEEELKEDLKYILGTDRLSHSVEDILPYEEDYLKILKINWQDAQTINETLSLLEVREQKLVDVITIGYLIDEDENCIKVCGFLFPDKDSGIEDSKGNTGFREVHVIPKKLIKSILVLETNWEESKKLRDEKK